MIPADSWLSQCEEHLQSCSLAELCFKTPRETDEYKKGKSTKANRKKTINLENHSGLEQKSRNVCVNHKHNKIIMCFLMILSCDLSKHSTFLL